MAGGPLAMWTSFLVNSAFILMSTAILCEICSALPISGSVYIWASVAAGAKYGRFVGLVDILTNGTLIETLIYYRRFIVAWWVATTWMTFVAVCCQVCALDCQISNLFQLETA